MLGAYIMMDGVDKGRFGPLSFLFAFFWAQIALTGLAPHALAHASPPDAPIDAKDIPAETFAAPAGFGSPQLSPDGSKLAYLIEKDGRPHLVFQGLNGDNRGIIPPSDDADINSFFWANDEVILLQFREDVDRWFYWDKAVETRFFAFNIETKDNIWLGNPARQKIRAISRDGMSSQLERLIDRLPDDPDHVLMGFDFDRTGSTDAYKVNVFSGRRSKIQVGRRGIYRWYTDQTSEIRMGTGIKHDSRYAIFRMPDGSWERMTDLDWYNDYYVLDFTKNPELVYVASRWASGKSGIHTLNVLTGKIVETLDHPEGTNIDDLVYHPTTEKVIGKSVAGDHVTDIYFDPTFAKVQQVVDKALNGYVNRIVSKASNTGRYLIHSYASDDPGEYFLLDTGAGSLKFVAARRSKLDPASMAKTKGYWIKTRDGTSMQVYVTHPQKPNGAGVLLPHGGPFGVRSDADWSYWAQFYASRGYTVLQPNFRGSGGYGNKFEAAGYNQFGGVMQDDITDATRWMIGEGLADKDRICIVGGSYGGYAALMGVIKNPGLYQCAISVNGVADLPWLKNNDKGYADEEEWLTKVGLTGVPDEQVSPYDQSSKISAPVLLIAAKDDMRIPYEMSRDLHNRLKKNGQSSSFVKIPKGGHSLRRYEARLTMLQETEKFLAKHIGR